VRGRDSRGAWRTPFSPFRFGGAKDWLPYDCTEGNAWQYTWHVFQDPEGLIAAHGGKKAFAAKLRGIFSMRHVKDGEEPDDCTGRIGEYIQGNEPSHHLLYFFPQIGEWDFAAEKIRYVCGEFYRNAVDGLCGNDDCGQMSAWYVFACMGIYPYNPASATYVIGAPQAKRVRILLENGRTLTTVAKDLSEANLYVQGVTWNGRPVKGFVISHTDLMQGGELVFQMGERKQR
jgi:predicted alpha-1,2-mannosidase